MPSKGPAGATNIIELLIASGCDPLLQDGNGRTAEQVYLEYCQDHAEDVGAGEKQNILKTFGAARMAAAEKANKAQSDPQPAMVCSSCGATGAKLSRCAGCSMTDSSAPRYCSHKCQRAAWSTHKLVCAKAKKKTKTKRKEMKVKATATKEK